MHHHRCHLEDSMKIDPASNFSLTALVFGSPTKNHTAAYYSQGCSFVAVVCAEHSTVIVLQQVTAGRERESLSLAQQQ